MMFAANIDQNFAPTFSPSSKMRPMACRLCLRKLFFGSECSQTAALRHQRNHSTLEGVMERMRRTQRSKNFRVAAFF
jgi:hypothetical protein